VFYHLNMAEVVVTGCSSGFGLLTSLAFARRGDRVFAGVRTPASATRLAEQAHDEGLEIQIIELDVDSTESVVAAIGAVLASAGRIDTVVNNAGVAAFASVEDTELVTARAIFETNFFGPLRVIQAVMPAMRRQGSGRIINVSSGSAIIGSPFGGVYSASKAALESLSEALAFEVGPLGVSVAVVQPGAFHTPIDQKLAKVAPSTVFPGIAEMVAAGREAGASDRPEEVADAIVSIAGAPSPPFRIQVGADARQVYAARREMDDETLVSALMSMFPAPDGDSS
jgi:NAD(P)-dependent dehydrogenase (short-subunit alcohol dehydrogenase family)